jgi:hypothetical protein
MRTLIVCESMFGNTREIADAVAETLAAYGHVEVIDVSAAPPVVAAGTDLVVVGAPTHAFGLSRPNTRRSAVDQGASAEPAVGVREWLAALTGAAGGICAAAFDTRIARPRMPGSAARAAHRRLAARGFRMVADPESFWVTGTAGPIRPGEMERAHRWAYQLATTMSGRRPLDQWTAR